MPVGTTTSNTTLSTERQVLKKFTESIAMDTPIRSRIRTEEKPLSTTPEWGIEGYHARSKAGWIEGARPTDAQAQSNQGTEGFLKGRFIKLLRPVRVTKEQELMHAQYVNKGKDPMAKSVEQATKELYVDAEFQIMSDDEAVAPAAGTTASASRGLFRWLSNANGRFTDADTTPVAGLRTPTTSIIVSKATPADVAETDIRNLVTSVVTARKKTGQRLMGVCQPTMRDRFDDFSRITGVPLEGATETQAVYRFNQKQGSIDREITFYKSSNGRIELETCFNMDPTVHFGAISMELLALGYAQPVMVNPESGTSAQVKEREIDTLFVLMPLLLTGAGKIITGATA